MFQENITKEEISNLPTGRYEGEVILVNRAAEIPAVFAEVSKHKYVGFDTETKPIFKRGERNPVALIQIAIPDRVYLIRINRTGIGDEIISFFENELILKIGIAISQDAMELLKLQQFIPAGFVDFEKEVKHIGIQSNGLRKLVGIMLGIRISKSAQISNWEAVFLSKKQINYAATDAWACLEMYQKYLDI